MARKIKAELLVNVQGDLPFIQRRNDWSRRFGRCGEIAISRWARYARRFTMKRNGAIRISSKCSRTAPGWRCIFTRAPIPFVRNESHRSERQKDCRAGTSADFGAIVISGLYVYRRDFLLKFARLRPTALEQIESLEQLRALENGYRIYVAEVDERSVEVDTPADLKRAESYLKRRSN